MDVPNGAVSNRSMGQSNSSERCEHCGALMVLVMPVNGKGPGALRCWECDRVDPMQLPSTTAWLVGGGLAPQSMGIPKNPFVPPPVPPQLPPPPNVCFPCWVDNMPDWTRH